MTRYADRYPELHYFFGGYFHQNWPDDHRLAGASIEDIVRYFKAMDPATVSQATRELEAFMKLNLSENELERVVVYDLRANVNPPGRGRTYRQWLEAVLAILKQPAGG